jgi:formylglycine-generating enzyme required for sulfatase activity
LLKMACSFFILFLIACFRENAAVATSGPAALSDIKPGPPLIPTGVSAAEGNRSVKVAWKPVTGAVSYNIYYATSPSVSRTNGARLARLRGESYKVRRLNNKIPYFFVVTAVNADGESPESPAVMATPLAEPPRPGLVRIPAGEFRMGDNLDGMAHARPVHTVDVDEFFIDKYETTYALWKEVHDWAIARGYRFDNSGSNGSSGRGSHLPVTMVSWYDALKWLNARSEKEGRTPVYYTDDARTIVYREGRCDVANAQVAWNSNGYRLPTEAEWEKAARGGLPGKRYPWGDELGAGSANASMGMTMTVGIYPPNGYGLHDMAGNVFEWVWDWGSESQAYGWAVDGLQNPHGPDASDRGTRVRRGGGFKYGSRELACAARMFRAPTYTAPYFGFRSAANSL